MNITSPCGIATLLLVPVTTVIQPMSFILFFFLYREMDRQAERDWQNAEQVITTNLRNEERKRKLHEDMNPSRRPLHRICVLISLLTGLAAFAMGVGQVVGLIFQSDGPIQYVLRVYIMLLCILAILIELEWTKFARESKIFSVWISRGCYYAFIGVLGLEQNDTEESMRTDRPWFSVSRQYLKCVAWLMIAFGLLYSAMGILCLQLVYIRLRTDYQDRLSRAPEIRRAAAAYRDAPGDAA